MDIKWERRYGGRSERGDKQLGLGIWGIVLKPNVLVTSVAVILMRTRSNRRHSNRRHVVSPKYFFFARLRIQSNDRTGLHSLNCWPKGSIEIPK